MLGNKFARLVSFVGLWTMLFCPKIFSQSGDAVLSTYQFTEGNSEAFELTLNFRSGTTRWISVESPFLRNALPEAIKKNGAVIALTPDSVLFAKKIPNTAWFVQLGNTLAIHLADPLQNGDRCVLSLMQSVPVDQRDARTDSSRSEKTMRIWIAENAGSKRIKVSLPKPLTTRKQQKP